MILRQERVVFLWLGMLALLVAELSLMSAQAPEARLLVYSVLNLPILKALISLMGMAGILMLLSTEPVAFPNSPFSLWKTAIHLVVAMLLGFSLRPLFDYTVAPTSGLGALPLWILVFVAFVGSWMSCLATPRQWLDLAKAHGKVAVLGLVIAALTPYLADIAEEAWKGRMIDASFSLGSQLLSFAFDDVIIKTQEQIFGVPGFQIFVHYSCSGYEGVGLITLFLGFYLFLRRKELSFPGALLLLPLGMVASWIANGFRLAGLVAIGAWVSPTIAMGGFHSNAGWLAFVLLGLAFVFVVDKFGFFHKEAKLKTAPDVDFPSAPYLAPLLIQLMMTTVFAAFTVGLDVFYPARMLIVVGVLWSFRKTYSQLEIFSTPSFLSVAAGIAVYALWIGLIPEVQAVDPRSELPGSLVLLWFFSRLLGSAIVVPLVEELAFRGYLLRRLQDRWFWNIPIGRLTVFSVAVSSIIFGAMHQAWFAGCLAGAAYAWVTSIRGRLGDAVLAHAVTNFCIALHVVALHRWDLWV